jgi:hypothetical protein
MAPCGEINHRRHDPHPEAAEEGTEASTSAPSLLLYWAREQGCTREGVSH